MIDFRYHIVSIVSIFLALAVGILLGAGPLQEDLGKTLSSQVDTLRQEKTDLRTELSTATTQVEAGNEAMTGITPQLVARQLGGRSVVLVALPGSSSDDVGNLAKVLTAAGADVNGTVSVARTFTDVGRAAFRDELSTTLAPATGTTPDAGAALDERMASLLAGALLVPRLTDADRTTPAATQTLAALKTADLVGFSGDGPPLSTLAVVVAPAPDAGQAAAQRTADIAGWTALARALDAAGAGAVVVGRVASADSGGLVSSLRQDGGVRRAVSTVDDVDDPMGRISTVFALREQVGGDVGHYGVATSATAVIPEVPAASSGQ